MKISQKTKMSNFNNRKFSNISKLNFKEDPRNLSIKIPTKNKIKSLNSQVENLINYLQIDHKKDSSS